MSQISNHHPEQIGGIDRADEWQEILLDPEYHQFQAESLFAAAVEEEQIANRLRGRQAFESIGRIPMENAPF